MSDTTPTATNGVHSNGHDAGDASKHKEMQYLDMIRDIMARGQVRVSWKRCYVEHQERI